jgi:hypothetical protein
VVKKKLNWSSKRGKRGSCKGKKKFATYDLVEAARKQYDDRVAMQFGKFQSFWCNHHKAWHLGHHASSLTPRRLGTYERMVDDGQWVDLTEQEGTDANGTE